MATVKVSSAKGNAGSDNVVLGTDWANSAKDVRDKMISCAFELAETSRMATNTVVEGVFGYGRELRDINANVTKLMATNLAALAQKPALGSVDTQKAQNDVSELMQQFQRVAAANTRLLDASSAACQALATVPSQILESIAAE